MLHRAQKQATPKATMTLVIAATAAILLTLLLHVYWQMQHDNKPRNPWQP